MGIWDRLGNVIKSYINDGVGARGSNSEKIFGRSGPEGSRSGRRGDPDLDAAYEELDEFLNRGRGGSARGNAAGQRSAGAEQKTQNIPDSLKRDFAELGLAPGASAEECKNAYKKLLKIHHPDRHTNNPENLKKATEKSARVNAAYERLEAWFKTR